MVTGPPKITYDDAKHAYTLDGEKVPGVTTILGAVESKPALTWWGMRVGLAGFVTLMQKYGWAELANANTYEEILAGVPAQGREWYAPKRRNAKAKTMVEGLIIQEKLSTNHVRDDAAERGTTIHNAMEQLGLGMDVQDVISAVPDEYRGFVQSLCGWWLDHEPEFLEQEVIVASREHQYAGRFDAVVYYHAGPHKGKVVLADLKTSKSVYVSHLVQLDAYDIAYSEMGLAPPGWQDAPGRRITDEWPGFDAHHVIHAPGTGNYGLVESRLIRGCFVPRVNLYHHMQREAAIHKEL